MKAIALTALLLAPSAAAASGLDIEPSAVDRAMQEAASRINVPLHMTLVSCAGATCRWDIGDGVEVTSTSYGGKFVDQLEALWNNNGPRSSEISQALFMTACSLVALTAAPERPNIENFKIAERIALVRFSKKEQQDVEVPAKDLKFYGSRSRPSEPSFPAEAFMQCGVVRNVE